MKRTKIIMRIIAVCQFIGAAIGLVYLSVEMVFLTPGMLNSTGLPGDEITSYIISLFLSFVMFSLYIILCIIGGLGLLKKKKWGKIATILHATLIVVLGLIILGYVVLLRYSPLLIPFSLIFIAIGTLAIIYLTKQEVKEYFIPVPKASLRSSSKRQSA